MLFDKKKDDSLELPPLPPENMEEYLPQNEPSFPDQVNNLEKSEQVSGAPLQFQQAPMQQQMHAPQPAPMQIPVSAPPIATPKPSNIGQQDELEMFTEDLEKIANAIIEEKTEKLKEQIKDLEDMKRELTSQLNSLSTQIAAVNERVNNIENAVLSKVKDYNANIKNVRIELEAVGKVFEKIIPEFTTNVRDLREIVEKGKTAKTTITSTRRRGRPRKSASTKTVTKTVTKKIAK